VSSNIYLAVADITEGEELGMKKDLRFEGLSAPPSDFFVKCRQLICSDYIIAFGFV
jgi:hypothetical protein